MIQMFYFFCQLQRYILFGPREAEDPSVSRVAPEQTVIQFLQH